MSTRAISLTGVRVLVVDDDPDQNELHEFAFNSVGAEACSVESVAEARAVLERERFDVVVSDVVLPDESSYELVRWLRAMPGENRNVVAIALTGLNGDGVRDEAIKVGFDEHCVKPCALDDLFGVIRHLIGGVRTIGTR